jgi:hypothetical protein
VHGEFLEERKQETESPNIKIHLASFGGNPTGGGFLVPREFYTVTFGLGFFDGNVGRKSS